MLIYNFYVWVWNWNSPIKPQLINSTERQRFFSSIKIVLLFKSIRAYTGYKAAVPSVFKSSFTWLTSKHFFVFLLLILWAHCHAANVFIMLCKGCSQQRFVMYKVQVSRILVIKAWCFLLLLYNPNGLRKNSFFITSLIRTGINRRYRQTLVSGLSSFTYWH